MPIYGGGGGGGHSSRGEERPVRQFRRPSRANVVEVPYPTVDPNDPRSNDRAQAPDVLYITETRTRTYTITPVYTFHTAADEKTCPVCAQFDGQSYEAGQTYDWSQSQSMTTLNTSYHAGRFQPWFNLPVAVVDVAIEAGAALVPSGNNAGAPRPPLHRSCRCYVTWTAKITHRDAVSQSITRQPGGGGGGDGNALMISGA